MKVNLTEAIHKKSLLSHIVLQGLTHVIIEKLQRTPSGVVADVVLTVDGHEMPLEEFVAHWESQVSRMISDEAKQLVEQMFSDLEDVLYDLKERVNREVAQRLEAWER